VGTGSSPLPRENNQSIETGGVREKTAKLAICDKRKYQVVNPTLKRKSVTGVSPLRFVPAKGVASFINLKRRLRAKGGGAKCENKAEVSSRENHSEHCRRDNLPVRISTGSTTRKKEELEGGRCSRTTKIVLYPQGNLLSGTESAGKTRTHTTTEGVKEIDLKLGYLIKETLFMKLKEEAIPLAESWEKDLARWKVSPDLTSQSGSYSLFAVRGILYNETEGERETHPRPQKVKILSSLKCSPRTQVIAQVLADTPPWGPTQRVYRPRNSLSRRVRLRGSFPGPRKQESTDVGRPHTTKGKLKREGFSREFLTTPPEKRFVA